VNDYIYFTVMLNWRYPNHSDNELIPGTIYHGSLTKMLHQHIPKGDIHILSNVDVLRRVYGNKEVCIELK
jgi:hypothetical protein